MKDRRFQRSIQSEFVSYSNARGEKLIGFVDFGDLPDFATAPFIIIAPGFGETKTNALSLSYILAKNGFRVLRYDASSHTGESVGTIVDCTLSKLREDLRASLDFVENTYGCSSAGIILTSLSGVVGLRVAAEDPRVGFVGGLVPVVNLQHTLREVYNEDLVGGFIAGKRWGIIDILGFPINADQFLKDAVDQEFHTVEAITRILARIKAPTWFLVGSKDPWVLEEDIKTALGPLHAKRGYTVIESSMHQLHENPVASRLAMQEIAKAAIRFVLHKTPEDGVVQLPRLREVAIQSRVEKERRKLVSDLDKEQNLQFWAGYLHRFQSIIKVPDFKEFYGTMQHLLGDFHEGQTILDAGCGNGTYGLWLLQDALIQAESGAKKITTPAFHYIGMDFVESALMEARLGHQEALERLGKLRRGGGLPDFTYILSDLDHKLPFLDNYFDTICCSLVLSYVKSASKSLRELYRVLAPGGTIIISSLKPYADLSVVYRNFLAQADTPEDIADAKKLLTNAGLIRARETEGHFKFFGETEFMGMLLELGAKHPMVVRSFANQANIAVLTKA